MQLVTALTITILPIVVQTYGSRNENKESDILDRNQVSDTKILSLLEIHFSIESLRKDCNKIVKYQSCFLKPYFTK